jgi:DNA-binding response OmpR family regulator
MIRATVLVVDDDPHSREIIRTYLETRGYRVVTAPHGEDALGQLEAVRPEIVLLDVMMPGMDGWEVARHIRNHPDCVRTRIIMVTARSDFLDKYEGLRSGADDYLVKPVELEDLLGHIERNLAARERGA